MKDLKKRERTAMEAVARRFSATWEKGSGPSDAYIMVAGKRVAVEVAALKKRGTCKGDAPRIRLRFDKVVTRLMDRLQATLGETVPAGITLVLTIHAPIPPPAKNPSSPERKKPTLLILGF